MSGGFIIAITLISCAAGLGLNALYENKYNEHAIIWIPFGFQSFFLLCMLITWPNPEPTTWFCIWTTLTLIAYALGVVLCRMHAIGQGAKGMDVLIAVFAQCLLPLAVAIIVVIVIAIMFGAVGDKKKK